MVTAGVDYDVVLTIEGEEYGTTLVGTRGDHQELDISSFSPQVVSGPTNYQALRLWSIHAQDDFTHGVGHRTFKDPQGYHKSTGSIDSRHKGVVQLATQIVASEEDLPAQAYQMIDFGGNVYACYDGTATGPELLSNVGFETAGAGGDDVFGSWTEYDTGGNANIEDEETIKQAGSHSAKLTGNGTEGNGCKVSQTFVSQPNSRYTLTFYTRGDSGQAAGEQGDYRVWDNTAGAAITDFTATGVGGDSETFTQVTHSFTTPADCISVIISLSSPKEDAKFCYYDTVTLNRKCGGIRKYTTSTGIWSTVADADVVDAKVYCLLDNGAYLFAGVNDAQVLKSSDGAAWTTTGVDGEAKDYRYMALGGGKLWASKDGDNHLHWATSIDASDWDGDENDTNRITVGPGDPTGAVTAVPITGMQWFNGGNHVAREDGLWIIPEAEATTAYRVLDWSNERRTTNGKGMVVWNDKLIIPVGPRLLAFTGTGISDITPPTIGLNLPYTQYGNFEALATFGPYLYVAAQEGESPAGVVTLRPNAAGNSSTWNPAPTGSVNYTCVDDTTPDYFNTFLQVSGVGGSASDLYGMSDSGLSSEVITNVTVYALARFVVPYPPSDMSLNGQVRIGSTTYTSTAHETTSSEEWGALSWSWATSPATDIAWTIAEVDALEAGMVGTSDHATSGVQVTQVWVEVEYQDATPYRLLCWDGASWHILGSLDAGGKCLWLSAATDDLWICDYDSTGTNYNTRYMQVQEHSFLPKDDYPTTGTHSLESSRIHCELERVSKCFHSLWLKTNNLTADRKITVYYRTSGETWISLGDVTESPWQEISLSNIEGKYMDLRFDFVTDSATESPGLLAAVLEFLALPEPIYGYNITINVGDDVVALSGKTQHKHSARDMRTALKAARASGVPITYVDKYGDSHSVLVTKYALLDMQKVDGKKKIAAVAQLSMADAD